MKNFIPIRNIMKNASTVNDSAADMQTETYVNADTIERFLRYDGVDRSSIAIFFAGHIEDYEFISNSESMPEGYTAERAAKEAMALLKAALEMSSDALIYADWLHEHGYDSAERALRERFS